eukprot:TRINITY_DN5901_c0_g5_i1.p1 TRINITY_DN5901_c0_g5~~TRINITY_DN5901_c0_g5_i1.p1  ORF type:complete len:408 (-),score=71.26 TRINITY_DN5901_c0_g5_i1:140-1363(-)
MASAKVLGPMPPPAAAETAGAAGYPSQGRRKSETWLRYYTDQNAKSHGRASAAAPAGGGGGGGSLSASASVGGSGGRWTGGGVDQTSVSASATPPTVAGGVAARVDYEKVRFYASDAVRPSRGVVAGPVPAQCGGILPTGTADATPVPRRAPVAPPTPKVAEMHEKPQVGKRCFPDQPLTRSNLDLSGGYGADPPGAGGALGASGSRASLARQQKAACDQYAGKESFPPRGQAAPQPRRRAGAGGYLPASQDHLASEPSTLDAQVFADAAGRPSWPTSPEAPSVRPSRPSAEIVSQIEHSGAGMVGLTAGPSSISGKRTFPRSQSDVFSNDSFRHDAGSEALMPASSCASSSLYWDQASTTGSLLARHLDRSAARSVAESSVRGSRAMSSSSLCGSSGTGALRPAWH